MQDILELVEKLRESARFFTEMAREEPSLRPNYLSAADIAQTAANDLERLAQ